MIRSVLVSILGLALLVGCSEARQVSLQSDNGKVELTYACTNDGPELVDAGVADVVRFHIAGQVSQHILATSHSPLQIAERSAVESAHRARNQRALEVAVASYVCAHGEPLRRPPRFPEPGSTPPNFTLTRWDGAAAEGSKEVRLSDHRSQAVILIFWATWCRPCRDGYPELQALAQQAERENVAVYAVVYRDRPSSVRDWRSQRGSGVTFLLDEGGRAAREYGVRGIPSTFVIGPDGRLRLGGPAYAGADRVMDLLRYAKGEAPPV